MYEKLLNKYAINQLGYVVDDLEKAALAHSKLFGSGPFVHFTPPAPERTLFRGEEVKNTMEVAYGMYGDLQIELIKPTSSDPTPYTVPERKGFNHFSVWVDDFDAAVEDFEEAGFEVAMLMESSGGLKVAYVDCLDVWGHYVEIHNPQPYLVDMCKKIAEGWDGTDPYRAMGS
ncbi:VOC family protein [Raoultibacter timonensis]|uniref:Glyoxalase n=1 Tax=Raoultibacter timonensis TaxID=1907662 RepID=A0ABN6MEL3_9ACTN|nr:VOC family protein [Raoultibacter timonensis]BDE96411.1 glyoxalase [Raoultibacter timonensis]BDF51015.1 glyoxalase [Raoultibacter timonensis]